MKYLLPFAILLFLSGCTSSHRYDVDQHLGQVERDSVLTSILNYIFIAPPYTEMKDRLKPEHRAFYKTAIPMFSLEKYFVAEDGTNYYFVLRPAAKVTEKRGVGGYFRLNDHYRLSDFHEVFVTQIMSEADVKEKCGFLFDEMVKGNIAQYLEMEHFVQWPNKISIYDTTTFEWKMKPELTH